MAAPPPQFIISSQILWEAWKHPADGAGHAWSLEKPSRAAVARGGARSSFPAAQLHRRLTGEFPTTGLGWETPQDPRNLPLLHGSLSESEEEEFESSSFEAFNAILAPLEEDFLEYELVGNVILWVWRAPTNYSTLRPSKCFTISMVQPSGEIFLEKFLSFLLQLLIPRFSLPN